jgi:D-tagatose-1,6-bisphosphate aldolase subunit GatZ/KbaZ
MTPKAFVEFIENVVKQLKFPHKRLILGGDHLGPEVWKDQPASVAMSEACALVRAYVKAGYRKIHLDASMKLADDLESPIPVELIAKRTALLTHTAELTFAESDGDFPPRYVIGTEVPIPGGAQEEDTLQVTSVRDLTESLEKTRMAFSNLGLESAWERVIAVVVQPGVEFGDTSIHEYNREKAAALARFVEGEQFVYEAHSTDYQTRNALRQMVEDHFAILKVGPALTFAYREAVFALAMMENELFPGNERSNLISTLDITMRENPRYWQKHYHGTDSKQTFARKYSLSDRSRYYWSHPSLQRSLEILFTNLEGAPLPLTLLSQLLPTQYQRIRNKSLDNSLRSIIADKIISVLADYSYACNCFV